MWLQVCVMVNVVIVQWEWMEAPKDSRSPRFRV